MTPEQIIQQYGPREAMEYDVVIVGAGPSGLSAAIRIKQRAAEQGQEVSVVVLEKGSEPGAHILSGAVMDPKALTELIPDWKAKGAPLNQPVTDDAYVFLSETGGTRVPGVLLPPFAHNHGNYIVSLGNVVRWLAEQAEALGVEIFPGFAAAEVLFNDDGSVKGVATGNMGVGKDGEPTENFQLGMELHAKYTIFAEGARGHLGKQLIARFKLDAQSDPQSYAIGIKELWEIDPSRHTPGFVMHTAGWPMDEHTYGGAFLYHAEDHKVYCGYVVGLNYRNPYLSPFEEFQRWKQHPKIRHYLEGGKRLTYGARAMNKGGLQSLLKMSFPGGLLAGCEAGTLNTAKIKGSHTAMKSGMLAAEVLAEVLFAGDEGGKDLTQMQQKFETSWLYQELHATRNYGPALHKFGTFLGAAFVYVDQNLFGGKMPFTWRNPDPDHKAMKPAAECARIVYPKPDGVISFDRLSSVYLSSTNHEEDQPCHLTLKDPAVPLRNNLPLYDEPAQRYCPAGVYEIVEETNGDKRFQINAQNCVHCKTCDIKDPAQNINWVVPEGGGGPNYPNM